MQQVLRYSGCSADAWKGLCLHLCNVYLFGLISWWRHQMETFSALLALCVGNSPVTGEFPSQRPKTRSFDVFFDLRPNKRLSKKSWGWWDSLWRHCYVCVNQRAPSHCQRAWEKEADAEKGVERDTWNNVWVSVNNDFFCHDWGDSAMIFMTDEVTSQNHCRIASCHQGRSSLAQHCDVTTVDLWRHANARGWHCDVIFVDCSQVARAELIFSSE